METQQKSPASLIEALKAKANAAIANIPEPTGKKAIKAKVMKQEPLNWMRPYYMSHEELKETYSVSWTYLLKNAEFVSFDTETNSLKAYGSKTFRSNGFSLCVKLDDEYYYDYFPVAHIDGPNLPQDYVAELLALVNDRVMIMHNTVFDLKSNENMGGVEPEMFIDTLKLCHLYDENQMSYSLDDCTERYLGHKGKVKSPEFKAMLSLVGWEGIDFWSIREYGANDAYITYLLWEAITKRLAREPQIPDYWRTIEVPNFSALKRMKDLGVKVNLPLAAELEAIGREKMAAIESELGMKFEGTGSRGNIQKLFWEDLQLPVILKKKTGKPTLDKDVMERYEIILERQNNPIATKVLEFRGWQKAVSSFYKPYRELVDYDGRIRTEFKSHGTVTGRYSSSGPNLQQIPKEGKKEWNGRVKDCFMPEDGYELWEYDYSQLEFRLSASYAKEPKLLECFNDDSRDIFNEMSADLGIPRQDCKTLTYSIMYGAGSPRIMDAFGVTKPVAQNMIRSWYNNYPGIRRVADQTKEAAIKNGKVEIWSGRFRHFRFPKSEAHKAYNSKIQGGGADLVKVSMNRIHRELPELRMILQVHDALWFEIPTGTQPYWDGQIRGIMEHPIKQDRVHFKTDGHRVGTIL